MLILRRSNCIYTAYGIVTLKTSEWSNITKTLSGVLLKSGVIKSSKLFDVKINSGICCAECHFTSILKFCKKLSYVDSVYL